MPPSTTPARTARPKSHPNSLPLSALRPLTLREGEVLGWIVQGKRDGEIASILGRSVRTIQKHVEHILEKLHMETRTALVTWYHERQRAIERAVSQT